MTAVLMVIVAVRFILNTPIAVPLDSRKSLNMIITTSVVVAISCLALVSLWCIVTATLLVCL